MMIENSEHFYFYMVPAMIFFCNFILETVSLKLVVLLFTLMLLYLSYK